MVTTANTRPSSRLDKRHKRYSSATRHGHSAQENEFIRVQAARLSTTAAIVFTKLSKYTADQISRAANLAAIP